MQRLWPLQNGEFGSKIKNTQKEVDNHSTKTFGMFCAKKRSKKPKYWRNETILKIGHLQKRLEPMQKLQPLQNGQFGS